MSGPARNVTEDQLHALASVIGQIAAVANCGEALEVIEFHGHNSLSGIEV